MGLPWPPLWEEGTACNRCKDILFDGSTPAFVYAFAYGIVKCPGTPATAPDPNRVIRMTQDIANPCLWSAEYRDGVWRYSYLYWFALNLSRMVIEDISGLRIFTDSIAQNCKDSFTNQWSCGAPDFPGFESGVCNCFW